jgi:hypothetical protein
MYHHYRQNSFGKAYWSLKADLKSIKQYFRRGILWVNGNSFTQNWLLNVLQRIKLSEWHFFAFLISKWGFEGPFSGGRRKKGNKS